MRLLAKPPLAVAIAAALLSGGVPASALAPARVVVNSVTEPPDLRPVRGHWRTTITIYNQSMRTASPVRLRMFLSSGRRFSADDLPRELVLTPASDPDVPAPELQADLHAPRHRDDPGVDPAARLLRRDVPRHGADQQRRPQVPLLRPDDARRHRAADDGRRRRRRRHPRSGRTCRPRRRDGRDRRPPVLPARRAPPAPGGDARASRARDGDAFQARRARGDVGRPRREPAIPAIAVARSKLVVSHVTEPPDIRPVRGHWRTTVTISNQGSTTSAPASCACSSRRDGASAADDLPRELVVTPSTAAVLSAHGLDDAAASAAHGDDPGRRSRSARTTS